MGDAVLAAVAERLSACLRHSDTVARFGGDEFVALTPDIGATRNAEGIAAKFVAAMAAPFAVLGHTCQLGVSVGVALYPDHTTQVDTLPSLADAAMYRVKKAGRNGWRLAEPPLPPPGTTLP